MFRTKPGEGRALIEDWINRPTLRKLVEAFDGTWPDGDLETMVAQLVKFSEVWDYRGGTQSRLMFHEDQGEVDPFEDLTYEAADELGLMNPKPPSDDTYDYLLILGGLATGVEPRVKYAAKLIDEGLTIRRQIAGLGSYRELHEKELPISRRYAPGGRCEIDHLAGMMARLFEGKANLDQPAVGGPTDTAAVWKIPPLRPDVADLVAYAAVGPEGRPANTGETYNLFLEVSEVQLHQTALLVTSPIYVPYQHFDAIRVLGARGLVVETVGLMTEAPRLHPPTAYRQEVRSALRAAKDNLTRSPAILSRHQDRP